MAYYEKYTYNKNKYLFYHTYLYYSVSSLLISELNTKYQGIFFEAKNNLFIKPILVGDTSYIEQIHINGNMNPLTSAPSQHVIM